MPKLGTAQFTGKSGETYTFNIYSKDMRFNDFIPGVYLISRQITDADNAVEDQPIFVGESDHVDRALQSHDKQACFEENEYNRISFHRAANPEKRKTIADDLLKSLTPVCND